MFVPCIESGVSKLGIVQPNTPTYCGNQDPGKDNDLFCSSVVGLEQEPRLLVSQH